VELRVVWRQEENVVRLELVTAGRWPVAVIVVPTVGFLRLGLAQQRHALDLPQILLQWPMLFLEVRLIGIELFDDTLGPALRDFGGKLRRDWAGGHRDYDITCEEGRC